MGAFDGLRMNQTSHGFWGQHTATIDWCEENYTHTPFIAEFYNTITNFPFILCGLYGALSTISAGLPKRYALLYLFLSFVGIGSFGFHASLRWEWQLLDELPMIYAACYSTYLAWDTLPTFKPRYGVWGPIAVFVTCVGMTLSYIGMPNPVYHQVAFASIMLSCIGRMIKLILSIPRGHPAKALIGRMLWKGIWIFLLGFLAWNIDNMYCDQLRAMRGELGFWGFMLQGHGFWHLLTGYGAFFISTAQIYLCLAIKVSPDAYTIDETAFFPGVRPCLPPHPSKSPRIRRVGSSTPPTLQTIAERRESASSTASPVDMDKDRLRVPPS